MHKRLVSRWTRGNSQLLQVRFVLICKNWQILAVSVLFVVKIQSNYSIRNLHKKVSSFSSAPSDTLAQARYCFLMCYINDKGLAMNLGKPRKYDYPNSVFLSYLPKNNSLSVQTCDLYDNTLTCHLCSQYP